MAAGRLEAIWTKRMKRGPMDERETATLVAGRGIENNANQGGKRQVTILEAERWARVEQELGASIDPSSRRANLLVSGVSLLGTRGRILKIGSCRIRLLGETRPCERMDEAHGGMKNALAPEWGGGAFGEILDDGEIAVGDPVTWIDAVVGAKREMTNER